MIKSPKLRPDKDVKAARGRKNGRPRTKPLPTFQPTAQPAPAPAPVAQYLSPDQQRQQHLAELERHIRDKVKPPPSNVSSLVVQRAPTEWTDEPQYPTIPTRNQTEYMPRPSLTNLKTGISRPRAEIFDDGLGFD